MWLGEGAYHVLHYIADREVYRQTAPLREALKGPGAEFSTAAVVIDKTHAVLDGLRRGDYTTVVVGEHDADFLSRLFDPPLAEVLKRHAGGTTVWAVPLAENQKVATARSQ